MPKIQPEPNEFDDALLDHVGQEFRFDHAKGLAEWLKNSADAYTREDVEDDEQVILIDLLEKNPKKNSRFKITDFIGMTHTDIVEAFKRWGDPLAAKRGTAKITLGGHGNGGKFYMRQSFDESRFVTYRGGRLNVFGFTPNKPKRYGFLEGYEDREMGLEEALAFAGIDVDELPPSGRRRLGKGGGFTVVSGDRPHNFSRGATARNIVDKLKSHPQARRLIAHKVIYARFGRNVGAYERLTVREPEARPDFDEIYRFEVPATLTDANGDEHVFRDVRYPEAWLELRTSRETLRYQGADRVDFAGAASIIGSYAVHELGGPVPAQAEFLYGECFCPKLEDPEVDLVKNDREKLADTEKTRVLLDWVRGEVTLLAERIAEADARERRAADLTQSSHFNELLNQWKNKFMQKQMAMLFGGDAEGGDFGGSGSGSGGQGGEDSGVVAGERNNADSERTGGDQGGSGEETRPGSRAPMVLLSGYDTDPSDPLGEPVMCSPRHPAVYQRYEDLTQGVYWINTSRPLAEKIIDQYGSDSTRWRDYMFQRYVEIILKESIRELERKSGRLDSDLIDSHIDELYTHIHDQAEEDLTRFLFDEKLTP